MTLNNLIFSRIWEEKGKKQKEKKRIQMKHDWKIFQSHRLRKQNMTNFLEVDITHHLDSQK